MPLEILEGDITQFSYDVIVNTANEHLWMVGGVCGIIFKKAGVSCRMPVN